MVNQEKKQTIEICINTNDKAMAFAEQIADLFGETKYSISFFQKGAQINLNDIIGSIGCGFYGNNIDDPNGTIYGLKGGVDQPKIFNRFTNTDSPER